MNLKLAYPRVLRVCILLSASLVGVLAALFPGFEAELLPGMRYNPVVIVIDDMEIEDVPVTRQEMPETEDEASGEALTRTFAEEDTVETEKRDLSFFADLALSAQITDGADLEEEPVEFWNVSREPVLIKDAAPIYPKEARSSGLEGAVLVKFAVGSDGRVKQPLVLRGPAPFHEAALEAVRRFEFLPALQNEKPVAVWVTMPIRFELVDVTKKRVPLDQRTNRR